jgi:hypothetical protein
MTKLPQGMTNEITSVLKNMERTIPDTIFKTLLLKNLKDELGFVVPQSLKPRIVVFFAQTELEMNQAIIHLTHFLGDAFDYELSIGYLLPNESETNQLDHLKPRARVLSALEMTKTFTMVTENKEPTKIILDALLFSKFLIKVDRINIMKGQSGFEATSKVLPSSGAFFRARNMITYPSIVTAFETAVRNPDFSFEDNVDKNFDTLMISVDGNAMELPLNVLKNDELVSLFTKMVLNSESKPTINH